MIVWHHLAGHHPADDADRRARWYTTKTQPSYHDILIKLRRVIIAAQYRADQAPEPTPQENQVIHLGLGRCGGVTANTSLGATAQALGE